MIFLMYEKEDGYKNTSQEFLCREGYFIYNRSINNLIGKVIVKLKPLPLALALGLVWGINWFFLTWWMILFEGITYEITLVGRWYRGYNISPFGSVMGFLWGFLDGFLIGLLVALIYNKLSPLFKAKEE